MANQPVYEGGCWCLIQRLGPAEFLLSCSRTLELDGLVAETKVAPLARLPAAL